MKNKYAFPILIALILSSCTTNPLPSQENDSSKDSIPSIPSISDSATDSASMSESSSSEETIDVLPEGYTKLFWHDEFNGNSLSNDWEAMIGDGSNYNVYRWGNNELQYYKKENAYVHDDALHILALKERNVSGEDVYEYSSARLRTKGKVFTTYGYIVARIKLPVGTGMWPAFWMLPENHYQDRWWPDSGEIDIMEARGRLPDTYGATIHTANENHQDVYKFKDYTFTDSDISEYHTYGVLWNEQGFNFSIDGEFFFEVKPSTYQNNNPFYTDTSSVAPFDQPFHILLNLAIGGNYDGGRKPDDSFQEAEMLVDYVRIYQKEK